MTNKYTIERLTSESATLENIEYLCYCAEKVNKTYGDKYDFENMDIAGYVEKARLMLCRRDGKLVGFMMYRLDSSLFDPSVKMLKQDLLYCQPGTRAAHHLMKEFIDFGKNNADHIITMIGRGTNIKRRSLERLGFSKGEESYRIEVKDE